MLILFSPAAIKNDKFLQAIEGHFAAISFDDKERVNHAHGQTLEEMFTLRNGEFERVPDCVIWPQKHEHVEIIVKGSTKLSPSGPLFLINFNRLSPLYPLLLLCPSAACAHNVCLIPFGGGTTVSKAVKCPENEKRMIASIDMRKMNHIKWVDRGSMLACVEAGIVGVDLEERLGAMGLTMGHEPDSHEFSTMGGWIATRASGMKKNAYGNIEDIVIHIKAVTPVGTLEKNCYGPRISTGPDVNEILLGSEGMLGIITEATVKIRELPQVCLSPSPLRFLVVSLMFLLFLSLFFNWPWLISLFR